MKYFFLNVDNNPRISNSCLADFLNVRPYVFNNPNEYKLYDKFIPLQEIYFGDIFEDVAKDVILPAKKYKTTAYVYSYYKHPVSNDDGKILYDIYVYNISSGYRGYPFIQLILRSYELESYGLKDATDVLYEDIEVVGYIDIYPKRLVFKLIPTSIKIIPNNREIDNVDNILAQNIENIPFIINRHIRPITITNKTRIGLISNTNTLGYQDFINTLFNELKTHLIIQEVVLTKNDIISAIHILQDKCDCICIVSGGGSKDYIAQYSKHKLVQACSFSKVPIVTGIGHTTNVSDVDRVAAYNANTPTGVAEFLNKKYLLFLEEQQIKIEKLENEKSKHLEEIKILEAKNKELLELLNNIDGTME